MSLSAPEPSTELPKIRADLIRRLFAVAISVGFATTVATMDCVRNGTPPTFAEWEQVSILITALIATVLSWDGYLLAIETRQLVGFWRYAIDIVLVFIYMLLLLTSKHYVLWLPIISAMFLLYVIWDLLTIREHMRAYNPAYVIGVRPQPSIRDVLYIYWAGFMNYAQIHRGPINTLSWTIYFLVLTVFYIRYNAQYNVFAACVFAIAGLVVYRMDNYSRRMPIKPGYSMITRLGAIVLLLLSVALYYCLFRVN